MVKRNHIYTTVVLLMILTFAGGIILGFNISTKQETDIQKIIRTTELATESYLIEQDLIGSSQSCELTNQRVSDIFDEIDSIGTKLNAPKASQDLEDFDFLKRKYYVLQIKAYVFYQRLKSECDITTNIILYYYRPNADIDIGPMLSDLATSHDVRVFPVEFGFSKEIEFMETYYEINETPTVIVNYEAKRERPTREDILEVLE